MRTPELDGQLYFVYALPADAEWTTPVQGRLETQEHQLSVLAWSRYEVIEDPQWEVVQGLMEPYMKIFQSMRDIIDLTDQHSFEVYALNPPWFIAYNEPEGYEVDGLSAGAIPYMMTRDFDDPRFMPITRDLSPNRIKTILNWIKDVQSGVEHPPGPPSGGEPDTSEGGN
jgi:hypothetical protein